MYMEGGLTYPIGKARYMELPTQWRKASPLTLWISTFISTATGDIPITRRLCCTLSQTHKIVVLSVTPVDYTPIYPKSRTSTALTVPGVIVQRAQSGFEKYFWGVANLQLDISSGYTVLEDDNNYQSKRTSAFRNPLGSRSKRHLLKLSTKRENFSEKTIDGILL